MQTQLFPPASGCARPVTQAEAADPMRIDPLTGEFAVRATEDTFLQHKAPQTRALLGFTLLFSAAFYVSFAATDYAALGWSHQFMLLLAARSAVGLTAATGAWLAYRR